MNHSPKIFKLGMLGLGTVGAGVAKILRESRPPLVDKTGLDIRLHKIAVRDLKKARALPVDPALLTDDAMSVATDPEIDILVEVIGGIDPARTLLAAALNSAKSVVTANKALLATHGKELFELALAKKVSIGFEASVCGGVPVVDAIRDGLVANRIESIHAILNGTTNYILTRMIQSQAPYAQALCEAQAKGYAEADPSTDVKGIDAGHKLTLLSNLAFHSIFDFGEAHIEGIDNVNIDDIRFAGELGYTLKLLGIAKRRIPGADPDEYPGGLELRVHPTLIPTAHPLANVRDVFNAVLVRGDATGEVMLYGRGAGMMPTASAIIADIVDAARGSARQAFTKLQFFQNPRADLPVIPMSKTRSRYYVRFRVADQPGAMGKIATVIGEKGVSIASVIQKEPHESGDVPIVMLTHNTIEERFRAALTEIEKLPFVRRPSCFFRVED
ncbi:MAG TPA: homoserine dehydrogenase [Planctomycetota bacterium]|nr:homoserine dehydrogenase [Planctomycetota bacterium]